MAVKNLSASISEKKKQKHGEASKLKTRSSEETATRGNQLLSMSLHAFKESLRPCCTTQKPSISHSILHDSHLPIPIPRIPPKSSLSQQLRRLHEPPLSSPPHKLERDTKSNNGEEEEVIEQEPEVKRAKLDTPKLTPFQFDHTGPFEHLLLSSHGELPLLQVNIPTFFVFLFIYAQLQIDYNFGMHLTGFVKIDLFMGVSYISWYPISS